MAHHEPTADVLNTAATNTMVSVNMINVTKLSSTNYITWSAQIRSLLRGYDLLKYIDPAITPPPATITISGRDAPNPDLAKWHRQDSLLYSAIMGSVELAHQPLIATATTTLEAWTLLASTYANATRGHIRQLRSQLKRTVKGTATVD